MILLLTHSYFFGYLIKKRWLICLNYKNNIANGNIGRTPQEIHELGARYYRSRLLYPLPKAIAALTIRSIIRIDVWKYFHTSLTFYHLHDTRNYLLLSFRKNDEGHTSRCEKAKMGKKRNDCFFTAIYGFCFHCMGLWKISSLRRKVKINIGILP